MPVTRSQTQWLLSNRNMYWSPTSLRRSSRIRSLSLNGLRLSPKVTRRPSSSSSVSQRRTKRRKITLYRRPVRRKPKIKVNAQVQTSLKVNTMTPSEMSENSGLGSWLMSHAVKVSSFLGFM